MTLIERFKAWRRRRQWPIELQLEHIRVNVQTDSRWLANDPKAAAICQRYEDMLADDWMTRPVRNIADFRAEIGCDPHSNRRVREAAFMVDQLACDEKVPFAEALARASRAKGVPIADIEKLLDQM